MIKKNKQKCTYYRRKEETVLCSNMGIKLQLHTEKFVLVRTFEHIFCWTEIILSQENFDESAIQVSSQLQKQPAISSHLQGLFIIFWRKTWLNCMEHSAWIHSPPQADITKVFCLMQMKHN